MNKGIWITLLVIGTFLMAGHGETAKAADRLEDYAEAVPITVDAVVDGAIEQTALTGTGDMGKGDIDFFKVELPSSGILTVYTTYTEQGTDTFGYLLNEIGAVLAEDDDGGHVYNFRIEQNVLAGTYYIAVRAYQSDDYPFYDVPPLGWGTYTLHAEFKPTGFAAIGVEDDNYGAIAVHENGEKAATLVYRDEAGNVIRMKGALWLSPSGESFVVVSGEDGLPKQAILQTDSGNYGFVFSNYTANTVDLALITPGKSKSVYITRGVPVDPALIASLRSMGIAAGRTFSLLETIMAMSPMITLPACAALNANGRTYADEELPCGTPLIASLNLYLPQYEDTVVSIEQFVRVIQCNQEKEKCSDGIIGIFDGELIPWVGYWTDIIEDWPVADVLADEGFSLLSDPPPLPPGINHDVLKGYHTLEHCGNAKSAKDCIQVQIFYDPDSNINVITANFTLDRASDTFLSDTYSYADREECKQAMEQYLDDFEGIVIPQGWRVKKRPRIDCSGF